MIPSSRLIARIERDNLTGDLTEVPARRSGDEREAKLAGTVQGLAEHQAAAESIPLLPAFELESRVAGHRDDPQLPPAFLDRRRDPGFD